LFDVDSDFDFDLEIELELVTNASNFRTPFLSFMTARTN